MSKSQKTENAYEIYEIIFIEKPYVVFTKNTDIFDQISSVFVRFYVILFEILY